MVRSAGRLERLFDESSQADGGAIVLGQPGSCYGRTGRGGPARFHHAQKLYVGQASGVGASAVSSVGSSAADAGDRSF